MSLRDHCSFPSFLMFVHDHRCIFLIPSGMNILCSIEILPREMCPKLFLSSPDYPITPAGNPMGPVSSSLFSQTSVRRHYLVNLVPYYSSLFFLLFVISYWCVVNPILVYLWFLLSFNRLWFCIVFQGLFLYPACNPESSQTVVISFFFLIQLFRIVLLRFAFGFQVFCLYPSYVMRNLIPFFLFLRTVLILYSVTSFSIQESFVYVDENPKYGLSFETFITGYNQVFAEKFVRALIMKHQTIVRAVELWDPKVYCRNGIDCKS